MPAFLVMLTGLVFPGLSSAGLAAGIARQATPAVESSQSATGGGQSSGAAGPVQEALREGGYPWYDSAADRVRPIWRVRSPVTKWIGDRWRRMWEAIGRFFDRHAPSSLPSIGVRGDWLGIILLSTVLATFFVFLLVLWLRREPWGAAAAAGKVVPGTGSLLAELPEGLRSGFDDPWAEAQRRRQAGDLAGAVIFLFAHQLISLDRMGLIRLAPGWTGRQYVRWLRDPVLVDALGATLGLFEEVYYGRRVPAAAAFERVWSRALALEERRGVLGASR